VSSPLDILVVDDEVHQREILREILHEVGHEVVVASSSADALSRLAEREFDLLLTDLRMPGGDGIALAKRAREVRPDLAVILMTAYATVESAVQAMKQGAHDYLQKPFSKDELVQRVARVAERSALVKENRRLRERVTEASAPAIVGESPAIVRLRKQIDRLAGVPGDVMITGESGTGKELVARRLHYSGPRAAGPFVPVNCAAIPESLAESELFGHEKGAFTHATSSRPGRFEQADGGTLFLDEVSSMPIALQAKLLRVLQDRTVERIGGSRPRLLDVRVVSATNRTLRELIPAAFREDLYHRLNVHEVNVPPLRDRREDIPVLAALFRDRAAAVHDVPAPEIGRDLAAFFEGYTFPGNVRELEHLMTKMVLLSDGESLTLGDLPESIVASQGLVPSVDSTSASPAPGAPEALLATGPVSFADVERRLLREAIRLSDGNLTEAARRLGISYKTMRYRARKFGLTVE
jgi:DNA-binding NtrC family response regulator